MASTQPSKILQSAPKATRRRRILYAILILFALTACYFCMGVALTWASIRPKRWSQEKTPEEYSIAFSDISFTSRDGVSLSGWYVPVLHPQGVIVLCHGIDGSRGSMLGCVGMLHQAGFATVLFDFRARGLSGGALCTLGLREPEDIQAAVRWIEHNEDLHGVPIGILGKSLGGASSIMAAARTPEIRAIIVEAPFSQLDRAVDCNFREIAGIAAPFFAFPTRLAGEVALGCKGSSVSPLREIAEIAPRPILIIADAEDTLFPATETNALFQAAGEPKELWTVPGAGHCGAMVVDPEQYKRRITQFFVTHLKMQAFGNRQ